MIIDTLSSAEAYTNISQRIRTAMELLSSGHAEQLPIGRHEIDGNTVYAVVAEYTTKQLDQCRWEVHRQYADVQVVLSGEEQIGYIPSVKLQEETPYDAGRDIQFLKGSAPGDLMTLRPGLFALYWPWDAHMPCVAVSQPSMVKKIVVKILLDFA